MNDHPPRCEGQTFLGFTVKPCDQPATRHAYQDGYEQFDFCERHYYFWLHGHYPEDEIRLIERSNRSAQHEDRT